MVGPGLRLLCFDDGGLRGMSQLLILQEILNRIQYEQSLDNPPLPSKIFDVISGSGTGGILAAMFGHLNMSISEVILAFRNLLPAFSDMKLRGPHPLRWRKFLQQLRQVAQEHPQGDLKMQGYATKVFVCVSHLRSSRASRLRNYSLPDLNPAEFDFVHICQIACATPGSFGPLQAEGQEGMWTGSRGCPNSCEDLLDEVAAIFPNRPVACIISLGTGLTVPDPDEELKPTLFCLPPRRKPKLLQLIRRTARSAEEASSVVLSRFHENKTEGLYFRLNVEQGMQDLLIETAAKLPVVAAHTSQYLRAATVNRRVDAIVQAVIASRPFLSPIQIDEENPQPKSHPRSELDTLDHDALQGFLSELRVNGGSLKLEALIAAFQRPDSSTTVLAFLGEIADQLRTQVYLVHPFNRILPKGYSLVLPTETSPADVFLLVYPQGAKIHCLYDVSSSMQDILTTQDLDRTLTSTDDSWSQLEDLESPWDQCMAQLLQSNLDAQTSVSNDTVRLSRKRTFHLLRRFSARSILPPSFFLSDLTCNSKHPITGGGFADIWQGFLRDELVCLKVLRVFGADLARTRMFKDFSNEALTWRQVRHPNILRFLGVSTELFTPAFCLVSPFMNHGNILQFLENHPQHDRLPPLLNIATGLDHLHSHDPPIYHGDIRGANVLVKDDMTCCLGDFGLATISESHTMTASSSAGIKGSTRWLAPELLAPSQFPDSDQHRPTSRDVYAFGCTVVEILTGVPPFSQHTIDAAVILDVIRGGRPSRPEDCPDALWTLTQTCWTAEVNDRPSMQQVLGELETLMAQRSS